MMQDQTHDYFSPEQNDGAQAEESELNNFQIFENYQEDLDFMEPSLLKKNKSQNIQESAKLFTDPISLEGQVGQMLNLERIPDLENSLKTFKSQML